MKKKQEHTVVLVLALLLEVGLIVLFAVKARAETLQQYDWKHLAAAGLALFLLYILYVEIRIKRAGRTLVEEKVKTHTLVESLPQAVAVVDAEGRLVTANEAACRLLGVDPVESIGRDFPSLFDDGDRLRAASPGRLDVAAQGRKLRLTTAPLRGEAGSLVILEEREGARAAEPAADRSRIVEKFRGALGAAMTEVAARVRARKALNFLDDLSRLPQPAKEKVDVAEVARQAMERSAPLAGAKGLQTEVKVQGDASVQADRGQFLRALDEILFNAVSYTKQGSVRVAIEGGTRDVTVSCTDSGIGIPADEFGRVFDDGFVGTNQVPETEGGRGLGLALAKRVVEAHGGSIMVESRAGQGTRITLNIPRG